MKPTGPFNILFQVLRYFLYTFIWYNHKFLSFLLFYISSYISGYHFPLLFGTQTNTHTHTYTHTHIYISYIYIYKVWLNFLKCCCQNLSFCNRWKNDERKYVAQQFSPAHRTINFSQLLKWKFTVWDLQFFRLNCCFCC